MNKLLKYMLLVGVAVCMTASGEALGAGVGAVGIAKTLAIGGWEVVDITSGPAHQVVIVHQELLRLATQEEKKIKKKIRPRLSVVYEKDKKKKDTSTSETEADDDTGADFEDEVEDNFEEDIEDDDLDMDDDTEDENEENGKKKKRKIDAKLSKIKIKANEVTEIAGEGVVGEGVNDIIKTQGKTPIRDLVDNQQKKYISSAGTQETMSAYEKQRRYDEQEQAVQMIAYAATVRQNVNSMVSEMIDKMNEHYEESDVKKDLDPNNKKDKVEKTNDYNQVLREYAYYSLIYDQLLSLEQQVIGLRLQAKGALSEQKSNVLTDVLEEN